MKRQEMEMQSEEPQQEEGVEIPYLRLNPETLHRLIGEFVTRDWEEPGDAGCTLETKMDQVLRQLKGNKAKVVFDLSTETANIVACDEMAYGKGKSHV